MKVLIGGGSGFIGQHLKRALLSHGHSVEVILQGLVELHGTS